MITKDILLELFARCYLYDISTILMESNQEHYNAIIVLYKECLEKARIIEPDSYSNWTIGINLFITSMISLAHYQCKQLVVDREYRLKQMSRQGYTDEVDFMFITNALLSVYPYKYHFNIFQLLWSFKNQLYRSETFYVIYESKVMSYILEQQAAGNLSDGVINQIMQLL